MDSARSVIDQWIGGINAGEIEMVLGMYDEAAVLLPTFSDQTLESPTAIRGYFEQLAKRKSLHIQLYDHTFGVQAPGDAAIAYGVYLWKFEVEQELMSFEARFTYVLNLDSKSPIVHHHSSQVPKALG